MKILHNKFGYYLSLVYFYIFEFHLLTKINNFHETLLQRTSTLLQRTSTYFNVLQRTNLLLLIILSTFWLSSCQKDITTTNDVEVKSKNISNYQNWFEKYTSKPQNANFGIGKNIKGKIEPIWDKAIQIDNHLLELPFKLDGKVLSQNVSNGYQDSKISLVLRVNTNGSYKGFVTVLSPKSDFVTPLDNINIHNFKTLKFAGIISIYDLRGKYLDGYFVKGGKILGKIGDNSVQRGKASNNSLDMCCTEFCESLEIVWCTCGCWGPNPSCRSGNSCTPPVCETISGGVWCYEECYDCGGGDDCPDPQNPNCDDCPNPNNPNCDDGGGGCFDGNCDDDAIDGLIVNLEPCHSTVWNRINSHDPNLSDLSHFIETFRNDANESISISDGPFTDNNGNEDATSDGSAQYNPVNRTFEIKINTAVSRFSAQEYTTATILHEIIHAYLGTYMNVVRTNEAQHPRMVSDYCVEWMTSNLMSLFPNLSLTEATGLAWVGLQKDSPGAYNAIDGTLRASYTLNNMMFKSGSKGTPPSPPCTE